MKRVEKVSDKVLQSHVTPVEVERHGVLGIEGIQVVKAVDESLKAYWQFWWWGQVHGGTGAADNLVAEDSGLERPAGIREVELLVPSSPREAGSCGKSGQSVSSSGQFCYGALSCVPSCCELMSVSGIAHQKTTFYPISLASMFSLCRLS